MNRDKKETRIEIAKNKSEERKREREEKAAEKKRREKNKKEGMKRIVMIEGEKES